MKVLSLSDDNWILLKKKIQAELHWAQTEASFCLGLRRLGTPHWNEARTRKRHIEAIRLAKILEHIEEP